MAKAKLLNNGGYYGMKNVKFPAVVDFSFGEGGIDVSKEELVRIGASEDEFTNGKKYVFFIGTEAEIIEE